jgi:hypothetical protein
VACLLPLRQMARQGCCTSLSACRNRRLGREFSHHPNVRLHPVTQPLSSRHRPPSSTPQRRKRLSPDEPSSCRAVADPPRSAAFASDLKLAWKETQRCSWTDRYRGPLPIEPAYRDGPKKAVSQVDHPPGKRGLRSGQWSPTLRPESARSA